VKHLKKQILILSLVVIIFLVLPDSVLAASKGGLVPCGGSGQSACTLKDIFVMVARVTNTLIGLAGIYAVYVIIGAGFWLVVTMGNEEKLTNYKKQISQAVVGFVLVLMAYMFVNTAVNYILLGGAGKKIKLENGKEVECKLDLTDPLNYLIIHSNPKDHAKCDL
jgi:hypothetical protein